MKWIRSKYPGVRYREHPSRKHGKAPDRYFSIRYRYQGKEYNEGIGWTSQKITAKKAANILATLHENQKTGTSPVTLAEWREMEEEKRRQIQEAEAKKADLPQTFGELADVYLSWAKGHNKSYAWDRMRVDTYIRPKLDNYRLSEIEGHHVEAIKSRLLEEEMSASTITQIIGLVRRIYNHGSQMYGARFADVAPHNPVRGVQLPRKLNRRIRYLSLAEVNKLLEVAQESDHTMHDIVQLALYTGLRRGEIAHLTAGKVDLEQMIIYIPDPKSGRDEHVNIPEHLLPMLRQRVMGSKHADLVFSGKQGGVLNSISHRFKRLVDAAELNKGVEDKRDMVVFHTLRHTFISWLVINGTDLRTVQEMARHRSLDMTFRYAHLAPSSKRHAANSLPLVSPSPSQGTGSASD